MSDIQFSALLAISGMAIAIFAFSASYWIFQEPIMGYKIMVYPGIIVARFFSEEFDFWPKPGIMIGGQYLVFFACFFLAKKIMKLWSKCVMPDIYRHTRF